jgi:osmotically-inducible protein OsmY
VKTVIDDKLLQAEVMDELTYDPSVNAPDVGVSVTDGAVTLTGRVFSYASRVAAVRAAERVYGVRAVADEIEVRPSSSESHDDSAIAEEIARERIWNVQFPESVKVEVSNGRVTLRGEVEWAFEREAAETAVRPLKGVRSVTNRITIKPRPDVRDVKQRVEQAVRRLADVDADSVWIEADGGTVTLHGEVGTFAERRSAQRAAEAAPGVRKVKNHILVAPGRRFGD